MAILNGYEWVEGKVWDVVRRIRQQHPEIEIEVSAPPRKEAGVGIAPELIDEIEAFNLPEPDAITAQVLEMVLGSSRVLCICMEGKTGFAQAFERAGFPQDAISGFFIERRVSPGKNSNLMSIVKQEAKRCAHLLYAWDGLRTSKAEVKKKFSGKSYEAETASKVIEIFRRWVLGESKRLCDRASQDGISDGD